MIEVNLDCDGVLSDFTWAMLEIVREVTGRQHTPLEVTDFDFAKALGLTPKEASEVKKRIGRAPRFARRLTAYPDARRGVDRLRAIADVYVVTSPWDSNETWHYDRADWLEYMFDIRPTHIIQCQAKYKVHADVFVDDKASALDKWAARWPTGLAVHWQTPHNRREPWKGRSTGSWDELCSWVAERHLEILA